jgi:hypothetical protein
MGRRLETGVVKGERVGGGDAGLARVGENRTMMMMMMMKMMTPAAAPSTMRPSSSRAAAARAR